MSEPTDTTGWAVTILLAIAALVVIWLTRSPTNLGFILLIILLATCGGLARRYQ